jgi:hypothetical protein
MGVVAASFLRVPARPAASIDGRDEKIGAQAGKIAPDASLVLSADRRRTSPAWARVERFDKSRVTPVRDRR